MKVIGPSVLLAITIGLAACGSSEPRSPLILGRDPADLSLGPRNLTTSQTRALEKAITSGGVSCASIERTYLHDIDPVVGAESWDVQCSDGNYSVLVRADGTPGAVRRCIAGSPDEGPCRLPYAGRRPYGPYGPSRREPQGGPLNPDLQKLLEPMTAKDGKTD